MSNYLLASQHRPQVSAMLPLTKYLLICQHRPDADTIPPFSDAGFLFNDWMHLQQQHADPFWLLSAVNTETGLADARCAFWIQDGIAVSPGAAPFGSIETTVDFLTADLDAFLERLMAEAARAGATRLRLTHYPASYAPRQTGRLLGLLTQHDFNLTAYENAELHVTNQPFSAGLAQATRRRLLKAQRAGFVCQWLRPDQTDGAIAFLAASRQRQGYPLVLPPDQIRKLLTDFPRHFGIMAVTDGDTIATMTVVVRVRHDILYNFLPADNLDYRTYSPAILLTEGLYDYCQAQQIHLLDLGVSLDDHRRPKPSLLRFKRNLGAHTTAKMIFERPL